MGGNHLNNFQLPCTHHNYSKFIISVKKKEEKIKLWRSWLAFPVQQSASSYSRPWRHSCQTLWRTHQWPVSSPEAHSLIRHVGQTPAASSCYLCSASEVCQFSSYYPGQHLCFGHFHSFAWEQAPALPHSAPCSDIQRQTWLQRLKQSKSKCDKFVGEGKKKKEENVVTKLLTLAASRRRLCVYPTKLKFNICHVNLMEHGLNSHGTKYRRGNGQKICVCFLGFTTDVGVSSFYRMGIHLMADGKHRVPRLGLGKVQGRSWEGVPGPRSSWVASEEIEVYSSTKNAARLVLTFWAFLHMQQSTKCTCSVESVKRYLWLLPANPSCALRPGLRQVWVPGARR